MTGSLDATIAIIIDKGATFDVAKLPKLIAAPQAAEAEVHRIGLLGVNKEVAA